MGLNQQQEFIIHLIIFSKLHLSEEPVDVKLRRMIVERLHSHFFISVHASIDSSKATAPC